MARCEGAAIDNGNRTSDAYYSATIDFAGSECVTGESVGAARAGSPVCRLVDAATVGDDELRPVCLIGFVWFWCVML